MRKLGLIGGLSWAATESYYRIINNEVQRRAGPTCSPPLVIESLNVCELARLTTEEQWAKAAETLGASAKRLEAAGATALLICANAMYRIDDEIQAQVSIPIINIVDPVGRAMKADGIKSAAILGTRNVMTERWYRQRLVSHGVTLAPAEPEDVALLDRIIYDELMRGVVDKASERQLKTLLTGFDQDDIDAIALASTELSMIVDTEANVLPIYDSTKLHALEGVAWILSDTP
jgi:aspartate racemase